MFYPSLGLKACLADYMQEAISTTTTSTSLASGAICFAHVRSNFAKHSEQVGAAC